MARSRARISRDVSRWAAFAGARITNGYVLDASFRNYRSSLARLGCICKKNKKRTTTKIGRSDMPARTGEQFLRGLVDDRQVWVGSDKVASPLDHPSLRGAALALAEVYDLQHR